MLRSGGGGQVLGRKYLVEQPSWMDMDPLFGILNIFFHSLEDSW